MSSTTRKVAVLAASFLLATSPAFALDESGPGCYDAEVLGRSSLLRFVGIVYFRFSIRML